ncbi:MAG: excinuclease ABC subunit UvrC [Firmicutes bacterium]|nr:excinuclease ABC subunit UvrC [Bacillota bacterium]
MRTGQTGEAAATVAIESKLKSLPDTPGIYLMKDERSRVIYVGKARSLKNRVRSYFQSPAGLDPKTRTLVGHIAGLEYIATDSEVEALILENNLIKFYRPKYNIRLRDDKSYPYLKVTINEEYPRVVLTRNYIKDGSKYYGPYTDVGALRDTMRLLENVFPLRGCKPSQLKRQARPCLNAHIGRCLAPCTGEVPREEYAELVQRVQLFLEGRTEALVAEIEARMEKAADELDFERAARLRDQLKAVEAVAERQKIVSTRLGDQDVIGLALGYQEAVAQVFFMREGKLVGRESFWLNHTGESTASEVLTAFLERYYSAAEVIPPTLLLPDELNPEEEPLLTEWLRGRRGGRLEIQVPRRGEKRQLVELAVRNAQLVLKEKLQAEEASTRRREETLERLRRDLGLEKPPRRIEGYDISNLMGKQAVGSMVVFIDGEPAKGEYRRFSIKTVEGPNDYDSLSEVIRRRFQKGLEGSEKFSEMPDLLLIDGGRGQVGAAVKSLDLLGLSFPCFGLAKEEEQIFPYGERQPLVLPLNSPSLQLLQRVRDEAHRFALEAHRKRRGKAAVHSRLEDVPGIGPQRRRSLLKHFGSLARIREAGVEELARAPGMNLTVAQVLHDYLAEED